MHRAVPIGLVVLATFASHRAAADPFAAARFLPATVVLYAESAPSTDLLTAVWDHPLKSRLQTLPDYQAWLASEQQNELVDGLAYLQRQLGVPWRTALEKLAAGGMVAAFDGASQSAALLIRGNDEALMKSGLQTLVNIARIDATKNGRPDPVDEAAYRGIQAYRIDALRIGVVDQWLIASNSNRLAKAIVDRILDGGGPSLAEQPRFLQARQTKNPAALGWVYADLHTIRTAGVAPHVFDGKAQNPGAELLLGGLLSTLHNTPYATAELTVGPERLQMHLAVPHDRSWTPVEREYFFGPEHSGQAPTAIGLPNTLVEVRAYRGINAIFLHGPELFNEEINAGLAKANSDLSTLFGGRPFAEEILGALDGGLRFLAVRESEGAANADQPGVRLPGFAAVGRLKDPAAAQRTLRIAFQTAIGFVNLTGAQQGMPLLELDTQRTAARTMLSASYTPDQAAESDPNRMATAAAHVRAQISPTIAFEGDRIVLSSTRSLAGAILDQLSGAAGDPGSAAAAGEPVNSALSLHAESLRQVVAENRQHLIARNMLEKGHRRAEAEQEIDGLLTLLKFFEGAEAQLTAGPERLELSIQLHSVVAERAE